MVSLTERETEVLRLRDGEGLSWRSIAKELGVSKGSVNSSYRTATRKKNRPQHSSAHAIEVKDPEKAAEILDVATDPFMTIRATAKECGMAPSTVHQFLKRIKARYGPLDSAIRTLKNDEMIKLLEDRARRAFEYLDDFALAAASAKDLAIAGGVLIDKARLLKDEPTQIVSMKDRRHWDDLGAALLQESIRRGIIVEGQYTVATTGKPLPLDSPTATSAEETAQKTWRGNGDGSVGGADTIK